MPLGAFKAALMGTAGVSTGDVVLLTSTTGSSVSEIEFTSKITSTYGEYIFKFYNINLVDDAYIFQFNMSTDGGSNYNVNKTTTFFKARHYEDDHLATLSYKTGYDEANSTAYQDLGYNVGAAADESLVGELHIFNPASTTYVKQFYATTNWSESTSGSFNAYVAGYFNTTSACNAISFQATSGNFDGTIKMWGVK